MVDDNLYVRLMPFTMSAGLTANRSQEFELASLLSKPDSIILLALNAMSVLLMSKCEVFIKCGPCSKSIDRIDI